MLNRSSRPLSAFATLLLVAALVLAGCDSTGVSEEEEVEQTLSTVRVEELPADPATSSGGGPPEGTGRYTFFSLRDSSIVLRYDNANRSDSISTEWDVAFQSTNVLVNSGTSGPGQGGAYIAEKPFNEVTEVDTDRLKTDNANEGEFAIPPGSGNGWYNYNRDTRVISPIPGRTVVVRTADGEAFAKIRFISYYRGAPEDPAESDAPPRYYTFEYTLQTDGTSFE